MPRGARSVRRERSDEVKRNRTSAVFRGQPSIGIRRLAERGAPHQGGLSPARRAEATHDVAHVHLDRILFQVQRSRDLLVSVSAAKEFQNLPPARTETRNDR